MIRELHPRILRESLDSQSKAGRCNPATVIRFEHHGRKRRHVLPVGDGDDWSVFVDTKDDIAWVVSTNGGLGYAGIQGYRPDDEERDESLGVFLQADYEVAESLGRKGVDLAHRTILRRLMEYVTA